MKYLPAGAILLATAVLRYAGGPGPVTYVDHNKVGEMLTKGGALANGEGFTVSGNHRTGPGQVEVHEKETDIFYVTDGEATFVTGGTMIGGKTTAPNQLRGSDIQGGQAHHLSKGDVITIPAGTPHWFKDVPRSVSYFTVKVIKP